MQRILHVCLGWHRHAPHPKTIQNHFIGQVNTTMGDLGDGAHQNHPNTHMPQLEMQDVDIDMICDPQTHVGLPILKSTFRFQISMLERNLFDSMSIFDNAKFHALHILVILAPLLISVHHTPTTLRLHYLAECDGVWSE